MLSTIRQTIEDRGNQHVGLLAEYDDPGALVHAVEGLRERGYSEIDTFSPFPIHGMDKAMGLGVSPLGFLVFGSAAVGAFLGFFLQWYTSAAEQFGSGWFTSLQAYPINISNKPLFAFESSVPIIFELTILFSALAAVLGMIVMNGLPKPYNPLFHSERFGRATDDAFFVHVSVRDGAFDRAATADVLTSLGASAIEYVDHDGVEAVSGEAAQQTPALPAAPVPAIPSHTTGDL